MSYGCGESGHPPSLRIFSDWNVWSFVPFLLISTNGSAFCQNWFRLCFLLTHCFAHCFLLSSVFSLVFFAFFSLCNWVVLPCILLLKFLLGVVLVFVNLFSWYCGCSLCYGSRDVLGRGAANGFSKCNIPSLVV